MSLTGLVALVTADPTIASAVEAARAPAAAPLDITAPKPFQPFAVAAIAAPRELGGADRPVLGRGDKADSPETCAVPYESRMEENALRVGRCARADEDHEASKTQRPRCRETSFGVVEPHPQRHCVRERAVPDHRPERFGRGATEGSLEAIHV